MQKPSLQYGGGSAISNFDRPFLCEDVLLENVRRRKHV